MEGYAAATMAEPRRLGYTEAPGAQTGSPRGPVPEQLDTLAKVTERLGFQIQSLRERLTPVLAVHPVGGATGQEKSPASPHCPLHNTLESLREELQRHGEVLEVMLDALEI